MLSSYAKIKDFKDFPTVEEFLVMTNNLVQGAKHENTEISQFVGRFVETTNGEYFYVLSCGIDAKQLLIGDNIKTQEFQV